MMKENQKEESIVNNAYVPEEERVLDPTLLDKSLLACSKKSFLYVSSFS